MTFDEELDGFMENLGIEFGEALASGRVTMEELEASRWTGALASDNPREAICQTRDEGFESEGRRLDAIHALIAKDIEDALANPRDTFWGRYRSPTPAEREKEDRYRLASLKAMGVAVCSCRPVEKPDGRKLIYSPSCEVHGSPEFKRIEHGV